MIIAKWKWTGANFQCSECRLKSDIVTTECPFCGATMSNWEEVLIDLFRNKEKSDDRNQKYEDAT